MAIRSVLIAAALVLSMGTAWAERVYSPGASGCLESDEFQVNTWSESVQRNPSIAFSPCGDFVVTWESWKQAL